MVQEEDIAADPAAVTGVVVAEIAAIIAAANANDPGPQVQVVARAGATNVITKKAGKASQDTATTKRSRARVALKRAIIPRLPR